MRFPPLFLCALLACNPPRHPASGPLNDEFGTVADRIVHAALSADGSWRKLEHICDGIGQRLTGSPQLDQAIQWAAETLNAEGLENVRTEEVMAPHWTRGAERVELIAPVQRTLVATTLGNSAGTPPEGVSGEVIVVASPEELELELEALGQTVQGKIVLINHVMPPYGPNGSGYGRASTVRLRGPARAAKAGALAVLTRSATAVSLRSPHTGVTLFGDQAPIPAAALALEDADLIVRLSRSGPVVVRLTLGAQHQGEVPSANVVAEIRGHERPDEIVLVSAHSDSWDVGQGAHDDGAGMAAVMELGALLCRLALKPRRTIRIVLFTNEENGVAGARAYGERHGAERHVAAIEMDEGGFAPVGFGVDNMGPRSRQLCRDVAGLPWQLGATRVREGGGGVDIEVALADRGVPLLGLEVDGRTYFDVHHTEADTLDKVNPEDLRKDVAALAVMTYVLADMSETLGRD